MSSGTRGGFGRIVAMGVGLAVALLLLAAGEAKAGKYQVAQCGWYVGADASWADTTEGAKFVGDGWCVPAPWQDAFDGVHLKSFTRGGASTVSGTRFARWRWEAPAGTGISQVRGTWWHVLRDGMEQRIGVGTWLGGFDPVLSASGTDTALRDFAFGVDPIQPALEDRLLCARAESKWCSLELDSWSALRALTITIQDDQLPGAGIGGDILAGGWRQGNQKVVFWGGDVGAGIRFGETLIDGGRVDLAEYVCAKAMIGGEWRATQMRPCSLSVSTGATIATTRFSDGPHGIRHCVTDFAGNGACTPDQTIHIDNNPPAHPRKLTLSGGESWRRQNDFDFSWVNPDQGLASSIGGAFWRITGPAGFDSGVRYAAGHDLAVLADRSVGAAGLFAFQIWLRDEAGNDAPGSAIEMPLRFDDVPPRVAFSSEVGTGPAEQIRAEVADAHSGAAGGEIHYRRLESQQWTELPTKFQPGAGSGPASLLARLPGDLGAGTYLFRAEAVDGAGNTATSTRRADGTEMALRKEGAATAIGPAGSARPAKAARSKTRIFARLGWRDRSGTVLTVPFGAEAVLRGRLVTADGAGLAERRLRIVTRPSRGALTRTSVGALTTGSRGAFRLSVPAGTSRRIAISYPGDAQLDEARRAPLTLRVRGGVDFSASPRALRTGEVVRLRGRVRSLGAPLPRRGKLIAIQYYEDAAGRWRPVLFVRTDRDGRFRARYRFRYVSGAASIHLRALALPEERWPYAPGASRQVAVVVTGAPPR